MPRTDANHTANDLPEKVIARLIRYLSYLEDYHYKGKESISSEEISENAGVKASLVRKDLCIFGAFGVPKVGYNVNFLRRRLRAILKLNYVRNMAWVGVDKFKELMSLLPLFSEHGCRILALFSHDPRYIGRKITNLTVFDIEKMELVIRRLKINVAVVATPSDKTQLTINSLLKCGVKNMLNYSESSVKVPAGIVLRNIGFSHDLKLFSFYSIEG